VPCKATSARDLVPDGDDRVEVVVTGGGDESQTFADFRSQESAA
jgi:hypothetical protein